MNNINFLLAKQSSESYNNISETKRQLKTETNMKMSSNSKCDKSCENKFTLTHSGSLNQTSKIKKAHNQPLEI